MLNLSSYKYFLQLLKLRLSITVVFSAVAGYLLGYTSFNLQHLILLIIGGFLVTGSANAFNQILEIEKDAVMERTSVRPLPQKKITIYHSLVFSFLLAGLGLYLLNKINPQGSFYGIMSKSSFFGLISILLYVLSYTPLKRVSTISIFVGAIPGAIPFLLGFVAATDDFSLAAGVLFAIQFLWQFPHFISIAWVLDDDYKRAGFKMLFGGKKNSYPAIISFITSFFMVLVSILPFFYIDNLNLSIYSVLIIFLLGFWFSFKSYNLFKELNDKSAKKVMLASFIYLPLLQVVYVLDRLIF